MTIIATLPIFTLQSQGYPISSGLPQGIWAGAVRVVGNASGGEANAQINFALATMASLNPNHYSLEQFQVEDGGGADVEYQIITSNMAAPFAIDGSQGLRFTVPALDITGLVDTGPEVNKMVLPRGIYLGRQRLPGVAASIVAQRTNTLNVVTSFTVMGYFWEPGALNSPGGLKKPADGLWK